MALAEDDDLHVGQHRQLHRHLSAAQRGGPPTGPTPQEEPVCGSVSWARRQVLIVVSFQGGTLNKMTKKSEGAEGDSDREPLTTAEDEDDAGAAPPPSANS